MSSARLASLLRIPQRTITSLTKDNSKRSQRFLNYDVVIPTEVSPTLRVPDHIVKPDYAQSGIVLESLEEVEIKTPDAIKRLRDSCRVAREVLDKIGDNIEAGISTDELDKLAHSFCIERNAYPSPLNYKWFPKSICTSINNVACHGIPDDRKLKEGDIISVDVSVFLNGYHGDCAETFAVGALDEKGWNLVETARYCLESGIAVCRNGAKLSDIGDAIQHRAEESNCSVVPNFCGHGIGTYFHGPPTIIHFEHDSDEVMKTGMTFTIEPVISEGEDEIAVLEDGWTAVTLDKSRTAQFEHTVLITDDGAEILTRSPREA
ncbi:methionine aminopeptidase 1D, mitochondrial [Galendromus occidentalis]|uniref:Methionine aminopeptidase n=1 Tax=Galendromus occidentalis TaxID=34638 RepID=A0AAJ6QY32_9ACAR|nr:methionine aminopeptidase 1D, mitochondrial [Galendromus occidentalis]